MNGRLRRLVLVARILMRALAHGSATRVPAHPKTILVVLTGKLGDIVCGTPVLRALRERFPDARILAAGGGPLRALLKDSGLADECLNISAPDVEAEIRAHSPDAALITGPSFEAAAHAYLADVPLVVVPRVEGGYSPAETKPYRLLRRFLVAFPYRMRAYAPRERLRCLEPLGMTVDDIRKKLGYTEGAAEKVSAFFKMHGIDAERDFVVGISPSAGHKVKEWPPERFAAVADHLAEKHGARVLITGEKEDDETVVAMKRHMRSEQLVAVFDLDTFKALIAALDLFISVDSGPIYIAEALKVPTLDITGPIDENEQPPQGPLHVNVVPPDRAKPELYVLNARGHDPVEARRQVESITVERVTRAADELIAKIHAS